MKAPSVKPVRCAIYTRVSTEHGLDQEFNWGRDRASARSRSQRTTCALAEHVSKAGTCAFNAAPVVCGHFEPAVCRPMIAVKRATFLLGFDWLTGLIGALLGWL